MFKPMTIGYYKQVRNNPRCKAQAELMPGMAVVLDEANNTASLPDATTAKDALWIVSNIIDKPEIRNKADFVIEIGEPVRADFLEDAKELGIELDYRVITTDYDELAAGDVLVADATGKWVQADGTTIVAADYKINLQILEKSNFGDKGIVAIVKVA